MRWFLLTSAAALIFGAAGSAAPAPIKTRTEAVQELRAAIEDERAAIALLKKTPPRLQSARALIYRSAGRLSEVHAFLSETPGAGAAESLITGARADDYSAATVIPSRNPPEFADSIPVTISYLEQALRDKLAALPDVRTARPAVAIPECSDGNDNDGDGNLDWTTEPGCTSERDARESSPFGCALQSAIESGQLRLSGRCSGVFRDVEFTLLDGVRFKGGFKEAPTCNPPTPTTVRCFAKDATMNPQHLIGARFATTSQARNQRVRLRFFDVRNRLIGRFTVPPAR